MEKLVNKKKYTLLHWITGMILLLLFISAAILAAFSKVSMDNLLAQEIENRQAILKLNVDNANTNLSSLQGYLYQHFTDSEEITMIETGNDNTKVFGMILWNSCSFTVRPALIKFCFRFRQNRQIIRKERIWKGR